MFEITLERPRLRRVGVFAVGFRDLDRKFGGKPREVTAQDLISTAVNIVPLSRTMKEQINHIRSWAFERAVRASPQQARR